MLNPSAEAKKGVYLEGAYLGVFSTSGERVRLEDSKEEQLETFLEEAKEEREVKAEEGAMELLPLLMMDMDHLPLKNPVMEHLPPKNLHMEEEKEARKVVDSLMALKANFLAFLEEKTKAKATKVTLDMELPQRNQVMEPKIKEKEDY